MSQVSRLIGCPLSDSVPAEVQSAPGMQHEAALALQRLGFRVLHVGPTISVTGSEDRWRSLFNVTFEERSQGPLAEVDTLTRSYRHASAAELRIPGELRELVQDVVFPPPPEFF